MAAPDSKYRFFEGHGFPDAYQQDGKTATFKTDFRVWLRYEQLMKSTDLAAEEKIEIAINLCYAQIPKCADLAFLYGGLGWFASCGDLERISLLEIPEKVLTDLKARSESRIKDYDQYWDYRQLWASFYGQYRLDLYKIKNFHWWAFMALFEQLSAETSLNCLRKLRTISYRDVSKKDQKNLALDKRLAALPTAEK